MRKTIERRMKKATVILLTGCMLATWTGCGSSSEAYDSVTMAMDDVAPMASNSAAFDAGGYDYKSEAVEAPAMEEAAEMEEAGTSAMEVDDNAASAQTNRKLITTVEMNVETKEFDKVMSTLEEQVEALGGYIENMETYNGSSYSYYRSARNASMTIRIPKECLDGFLDTVSGISNVVRRSEYVEDVTLAYVDLESHKNALRTEQTRLLELLERAESIEDIIVIEQRLSEVRYELESMESQLRTYDNKVDYSTVYLYVDEVEELTPVEEETVGERMVNGFKESLWDIGDGFKEFGIWFVVHIPYMVIWAIIITAIVVGTKKFRRNRRERKAKKATQQTVQAIGEQNSSEMKE